MITFFRQSILLRRAFLILAILHLAVQGLLFLPRELAREDRERDVVVYYHAAKAARAGQSLYRIQKNTGRIRIHRRFIFIRRRWPLR